MPTVGTQRTTLALKAGCCIAISSKIDNKTGGYIQSVGGSREDNTEPVSANYEICRFWLLAHLSRDKQHYLSSVPKGPIVRKGKLSGSSIRLGEIEL
ncbi:hypothetical protein BD408DRAFT_435487 [Parasitella parasitica]|nr:hypothetical protein BD408DRAFT_435487 [Parasitella parasitica]